LARTNTEEQKKVINHPLGFHAKVLAVAGSGKTTTMVERVKHLIVDEKVTPDSIQILMFNKLAREDFAYKLMNCGLEPRSQPSVNTFHSIALRIVMEGRENGLIESDFELWVDDRGELYPNKIYEIFNQIRSEDKTIKEELSHDTASNAISFWKGSLIKPENAGWSGKERYDRVYALMEEWRKDKKGMTYDDVIVAAVDLLSVDSPFSRKWRGRFQHIIVDEYQDINYAQQKLVELLASGVSDVMVVGDDDQTIYEWRGARPDYILGGFERIFDNKVMITYALSHSFRFGPTIAQCAENCIVRNSSRTKKNLVSNQPGQASFVRVIEIPPKREADAAKEMVDALVYYVKEVQSAERVIVLARSYTQLGCLEAELSRRKIPHRVEGGAALADRVEIRALRQYLEVALRLDAPFEEAPTQQLVKIVNRPKRYIRRLVVENALNEQAKESEGKTFREVLHSIAGSPRLNPRYRESMKSLVDCLEQVGAKIEANETAGEIVAWIIENTGYLKDFDDYYGPGKPSLDRKQSVIGYREDLLINRMDVRTYLLACAESETSFGASRKDQVVLTTIHRTKGLEFDYVFIPDCNEGFMPNNAFESDVYKFAYDKSGEFKPIKTSEVIENERRLFYVALTRARKGVIISSSPASTSKESKIEKIVPSRFIKEMKLEPTQKIMAALVDFCQSQNQENEKKLVDAVRENASVELAVKNVHAHYLKEMGFTDLAKEIKAIAEGHAEEARKQEKKKEEAKKAGASSGPKWWDKI
jgi:DNA helicase-2/ATP-dependent DNA helicase PcrA